MPRPEPEDLIFLDFEASGLGRHSWPVEIGLAWISEGEVKIWSSLIQPTPDWSMDDWDPAAENIHGLKRSALDEAPLAHVVAARASRLMAGRIICSDSPEFEERWAARLFSEQSVARSITIHYVHNALVEVCDEAAMGRFYDELAKQPQPHRAGPDAARFANALLKVLGIGS